MFWPNFGCNLTKNSQKHGKFDLCQYLSPIDTLVQFTAPLQLIRANILRAKLENKPIFALDFLCKNEENPPDGLHISYHKIKNIWS